MLKAKPMWALVSQCLTHYTLCIVPKFSLLFYYVLNMYLPLYTFYKNSNQQNHLEFFCGLLFMLMGTGDLRVSNTVLDSPAPSVSPFPGDIPCWTHPQESESGPHTIVLLPEGLVKFFLPLIIPVLDAISSINWHCTGQCFLSHKSLQSHLTNHPPP